MQEKAETFLQTLGASFFKNNDIQKVLERQISAKVDSKRKSVRKVKKLKKKVRKLKRHHPVHQDFRRPSMREMSFHLSEIEKSIKDTSTNEKTCSKVASNLTKSGNLKRMRQNTIGCYDEYTMHKTQSMLDNISEKSISLCSEDNEDNKSVEELPMIMVGFNRKESPQPKISPEFSKNDNFLKFNSSKCIQYTFINDLPKDVNKIVEHRKVEVDLNLKTEIRHKVKSVPKRKKKNQEEKLGMNDVSFSAASQKAKKTKRTKKQRKITIPN